MSLRADIWPVSIQSSIEILYMISSIYDSCLKQLSLDYFDTENRELLIVDSADF